MSIAHNPNHRVNVWLSVMLLLGLAAVGCGDEAPTRPTGMLFDGIGGHDPRDLVAIIIASQTKMSLLDSGVQYDIEQTSVLGQFIDRPGGLVKPAGTVQFNGTSLSEVSQAEMYAYTLDGATMDMNGAMNYFTVSGSAHVPSLSDSVASPVGETAISSPGVGDTVSMSKGFTITWNTGTADTALVMISPNWARSGPNISRIVPNSGSFSVAASDMFGWPAGELMVRVWRINYVRRQIPGTNGSYLFTMQSEALIIAHLDR